jgi:decaprenylphospho-beta-D-ribofuranose 2-oxidase
MASTLPDRDRAVARPAPGQRELLAGWGLTSPTAAELQRPVMRAELEHAFDAPPARGVLARGLGRSYGDAALNAGGRVVSTTDLVGIDLDADAGVCTATAGTSIDQLIRALVPRGFFVPVTPGTRYVTVGGAVAADIHGKNHHAAGSFCDHVLSLRLLLPSGEVVEIGPDRDPDLFWATAGGLGLTGIVLDATFRCPPIATSRLLVETIRTRDLDETMALMRDERSRYSVAWIDHLPRGAAMGRSVLNRGDFASVDDLPRSERNRPFAYAGNVLVEAPPLMPNLMNRGTIRAFNEVWYRKAPSHKVDELQSIATFFHPLDMIGDWNRAYGNQGFVQWQFALPFEAEETVVRLIEQLSRGHIPSFVNVLKTFGPGNRGPLSFPLGGWTLAIDIPTATPDLPRTLDRLDDEVAAAGGRIYLAKDSRIRAELIETMYPRLPEWREVVRRVDPDGALQSDLGRRLRLRG